MSLQAQIDADYKDAYKRHDTVAIEAFRMLKSAVKNAEIEARAELTDEATLAVVVREAKRRRESIAMFKQAGRQDLVDRETEQIKIIDQYLPAQMDDAALSAVVTETIRDMGATVKDFGKVMGAVMAKVKGQADGSRVTALVKQHLK